MITEIKGFEKYITDNPFRSVQFGDQRMYKFENNHGASVIFHRGSYGFDQGLFELMIVDWLPDGDWGRTNYYERFTDEYELLEFNEWQARVKGDSMVEKIEVPQAVYDEFFEVIAMGATYEFMKTVDDNVKEFPHLYKYLFENESPHLYRKNQLNLAKVIAGEAEFVPVEEKYYWQDKSGFWLGYYSRISLEKVTLFVERTYRDKLTESEIREKTSFDIDKLKKVSE